jgi:drug/metabolite transporter (DMT)-like permease
VTPHFRLKTRVLTAIVIVANVLGNFFLSWGLKHRGGPLGAAAIEYLRVLFNPWVAAGVGLLIFWLLSRMALLSFADLSFVLPVTSIGYVLTAVVGWAVLGEHISAGRWAGTLLIMGGTALVGSTEARTTKPETVPVQEPEEELVSAGGSR